MPLANFVRSQLREMVRKLGKVLCCMLLLVILGVDLAHAKPDKRWLRVFIQLTDRSIVIMSSCMVNKHKQKMCRVKGLPK